MRVLFSVLLILIANAGIASGYAATGFIYEYEEERPEAEPVPEISSLEEVAEAAKASGVPILVEFSTPWCRYCEALEEQVLKPLMRSGKYRNRIIVKKLEVNTYSSITGFDGRRYRSDQLSRMYNVDLYPTLVFFDATGREISQRIVGITVLEYVAGELDKAISAAIQETSGILGDDW